MRSIKVEFFQDADLGDLGPLHRLLFIGLWCQADREGRLQDKPRDLKVKLLPFDDCNVDGLLRELAAGGFIVRYAVDGHRYIAIRTFKKHQRPHARELPSIIPPPPSDTIAPADLANGLDSQRVVLSPGQAVLSPVDQRSRSKTDPGAGAGEDLPRDPPADAAPPPGVVVGEPSAGGRVVDFQGHLARRARTPGQGRRLSRQEEIAFRFEQLRRVALGERWVPDQAYTVRQVNGRLKELVDQRVIPEVLDEVMQLYLDDERKQTLLSPPCPLWAFGTDWPQYLSRVVRGGE
jgi:hypothetical protein